MPTFLLLLGPALVIGTLVRSARRGRTTSWRWRHGCRASQEFAVTLPVAGVIETVAAIALLRPGWRVQAIDPAKGTIAIRTRATGVTYAKHIALVAAPSDDGRASVVRVTSRSPQLSDWGENRRTVVALRRALLTPGVSARP